MDIQNEESCYRQMFQELVLEEQQLHTDNQKRIKAGIQCLIWIPMLFLILLFLTEGEKVIFLVLWIVSLFITAGYLIYVEYADFKAQERLHRYTDESREGQEEYEGLIGGDMEAFEQTVMQLLNQIDEKKAQNRQRMLQMIGQQKEKLLETERKEIHHD